MLFFKYAVASIISPHRGVKSNFRVLDLRVKTTTPLSEGGGGTKKEPHFYSGGLSGADPTAQLPFFLFCPQELCPPPDGGEWC